MSDVFISYARPTAAQALAAAEALRALGYQVWLDDQIPAHRSFGEVIEERIAAAKAVVVIWSAPAVHSEWVRSEAGRARAAHKLVQMAVEPVALPMPFDTIECAKLFGWSGDVTAPGWTKVVESVAALVGGAAARPADPPKVAPRGSPRPAWRGWAMGAGGAVAIGLAVVAGLAVWGLARHQVQAPSMFSLALLPVRNLSGDPTLDATAQALTQDVTAAFERSGEWRVAPPGANPASPGPGGDDLATGRKLKIRYVVSGSLRRGTEGLRLSYRVQDTADGQVLGEGDLAAPASDVGVSEARLAAQLSDSLENLIYPKIFAYQMARPANDLDPENLEERLASLEALDHKLHRAQVPTVERLIAASKAIPDSTPRKAILEFNACSAYRMMIQSGVATSPAQRLAWAEDMLDLGARASDLKPDLAAPYSCRIWALSFVDRWDEALAMANAEIKRIPNISYGNLDRGIVELNRGQFSAALADFTESDKMDRSGLPFQMGLAQLFLGHYGPAIEKFRQYEVDEPKDAEGPLLDAAALQLAGRRAEALSEAAAYRAMNRDDYSWTDLTGSHAPTFLAAAGRVRRALHEVGLDEPAN